MYHEIHRLHREGRSISHIADFFVMNWRTVWKHLSMHEFEYEVFMENQSKRQKELAHYEHFVKIKLEQYPNTFASQMYDWLKEYDEDSIFVTEVFIIFFFYLRFLSPKIVGQVNTKFC